MEIRKIRMEDANNYLDMLLKLDNETRFMMFEPGERPTDINIAKNKIENSIKSDNLILVGIQDENIVGFLSAQIGGPRRISHSAYIVTGILEKFRNKGIGGKFFYQLDEWAVEKNITRLELSVICSNIVAKHLYEKNGFKVEGIKKNSMLIDGQYTDEFFMAKIYEN